MSKVSEKVAYLDGLLEGIEIKDEKCQKVLSAILDTLKTVSDEIEQQDMVINDISEVIDDLSDDVDDLVDSVFDEDEEDDEDGFFEVVCPSCGGEIIFDEEMLDNKDGLICPHCNEPVDIDICLEEPEE